MKDIDSIEMSSTSADGLDEPSRVFYERAKFKLSLSLFLAALAMMFLGIAGQSGGRSRANQYLSDQSNLSGNPIVIANVVTLDPLPWDLSIQLSHSYATLSPLSCFNDYGLLNR